MSTVPEFVWCLRNLNTQMAVTDPRSQCQDRTGGLGSSFSVFPSERLEQLLSSSFIQDPKFICNCFPTTPWDSAACQISAQAGGEACWGLAEDDRGIEEVLDGCTFGEDRKHVNPTPWICSSGEPCGKVMILLSLHPDTECNIGDTLLYP